MQCSAGKKVGLSGTVACSFAHLLADCWLRTCVVHNRLINQAKEGCDLVFLKGLGFHLQNLAGGVAESFLEPRESYQCVLLISSAMRNFIAACM